MFRSVVRATAGLTRVCERREARCLLLSSPGVISMCLSSTSAFKKIDSGAQIQVLMLVKQALNQLSHAPVPVFYLTTMFETQFGGNISHGNVGRGCLEGSGPFDSSYAFPLRLDF